jgi:hypothetical protein
VRSVPLTATILRRVPAVVDGRFFAAEALSHRFPPDVVLRLRRIRRSLQAEIQ